MEKPITAERRTVWVKSTSSFASVRLLTCTVLTHEVNSVINGYWVTKLKSNPCVSFVPGDVETVAVPWSLHVPAELMFVT
jgi:hypothetical protein